jgi:hypothetical protein
MSTDNRCGKQSSHTAEYCLERVAIAQRMLRSMEGLALRRPDDIGIRLNVQSARKLLARAIRDADNGGVINAE